MPAMQNAPPRLREASMFIKILRIFLIGTGATMAVSAIVNVIAAWQLIDAAEEQALGFTRGDIVGWYGLLLAAGLLLAGFGCVLRSSGRSRTDRTD